MLHLLHLCLVLISSHLAVAKIDVDELKCLVCQGTFDELKIKLDKLDPTLHTEVGGYQLDTEGNFKKKSISQTKSEIVLSEIIDEVCNSMDEYVRVTWKSNGTLAIVRMILPDSTMNPILSEVNFITDDDLNKSLKYYCEELVEMYEEVIIPEIMNEVDDLKTKICQEKTGLCPLGPKNELKSEL
ncbi:hypothetical protein Trydic_g4395 [Trypoxylus dichotomus]